MKTRIGLLILFICMFVACADINNSFKQETVTVELQEYVVEGLLTQAEQDFCIDNADLVATNNLILNK